MVAQTFILSVKFARDRSWCLNEYFHAGLAGHRETSGKVYIDRMQLAINERTGNREMNRTPTKRTAFVALQYVE